MTNLGPRIELGPEFVHAYKKALHDLGVRPLRVNYNGSEDYDAAEINEAINKVGSEGFLKHMAYHYQRHARGLDVLENLAAEVRELARVAAMPTKLVRGKDGRSIGAQKVPGLGKLH